MHKEQKAPTIALLCGLLGCLCFGGGDWLMIYGDTAHSGSLSWLTVGAAQISPWRNDLAMALAFPGIIFYGIALFSIAAFLSDEKDRRRYQAITAFSLTPWLCLPLCGRMIAAQKYPGLFPGQDAERIVHELGQDISGQAIYRLQYMWTMFFPIYSHFVSLIWANSLTIIRFSRSLPLGKCANLWNSYKFGRQIYVQ